MTILNSVPRYLKQLLATVCMAISLIENGAVSGGLDKGQSDTRVIDSIADFLHPEKMMLRGCRRYSFSEQLQSRYAFSYDSVGHYCIAEFSDAEKWEVSTRGIGADIRYLYDPGRDSEVMVVRFPEAVRYVPGMRLTLTPLSLQHLRFDRIDSMRIWVKGNGSSDELRLWLRDRYGKKFTHRKPLVLNFDEWALEDLSFAPGSLLANGKLPNANPVAPLQIAGISIKSKSDVMRGEVRFDRLSVFGNPWGGESATLDRPAQQLATNMQDKSLLIEWERDGGPDRRLPMNVGSTVYVNVIVNNKRDAAVNAHLVSTVQRILGASEGHESVQNLGPGETRKISIPVNLGDPGWYRAVVCVSLVKDRTSCIHDEYFAWEASGNNIEDVPPTFPGTMIPATRFLSELGVDVDIMQLAGVKVLRFPFQWNEIESNRGKYNWKAYDAIFELCHRANIIPQPMVVKTPDWARRAANRDSKWGGTGNAWSPPENMESFRDFMEKAARRYGKFSPYWEIWNEPISNAHWAGGTDDDYIALLRAGYSGVKAASNAARVLSAGAWAVDGAPERFSRSLMTKGRDYFDILAIHSHGSVQKLNQNLDDVDDLWAGVKNRPPIWLNETGVTIDPRRKDGELIRASETVKKLVVARARGVENFGLFIFRNLPNSYRSPVNNYSVMDENGRPRPALLAFNNANRLLRRTRLERVDTSGSGYIIYEFSGEGRRILIAWALDPEVVTPLSQLPAWVAAGANVYDLFGGSAMTKVKMDPLTIELDGNPLFLVGRDGTQ